MQTIAGDSGIVYTTYIMFTFFATLCVILISFCRTFFFSSLIVGDSLKKEFGLEKNLQKKL